MGRIIFWVVLILGGLWFIRSLGGQRKKDAQNKHQSGAGAAGANQGERIVACRECGLHVPESEAIFAESGEAFCCVAHRAAFQKREAK